MGDAHDIPGSDWVPYRYCNALSIPYTRFRSRLPIGWARYWSSRRSSRRFARSVVICALIKRLGLVINALLWASAHDFFWMELVQQRILSPIFVYTRKSLPSAIAAHTVMDVIAAWDIGLRTVIPHYQVAGHGGSSRSVRKKRGA